MYTCDEHHRCVVVYETSNCPFCELEAENKENVEIITKLEDQICDLNREIEDLKVNTIELPLTGKEVKFIKNVSGRE